MKLAFIFPGQGSQKVGMGKEFYDNFSEIRAFFEELSELNKIDFAKLMFEENDDLNKSEFTQPAIVLNSFISYLALKNSLDLSSVFNLGHSLGEYSALSVSKGLSINDAIKIVNLRGKFMSEDCEGLGAGMMVVLGLDDQTVSELCLNSGLRIWPANYNCDGQIVVAGIKAHLEKIAPEFKNAGAKRAMLLNMSVASHCELMKNSSQKLSIELEKYLEASFKPAVISNVTAKPYNTKENALELLKLQLTSPVLYKQSIKSNEDKVDMFIEFGASILKGLNKKITSKPTLSIYDMQSLEVAIKELS